MRSREYGLGIIALLVVACLLGAAPRASAQGQPQVAAVATDEATQDAPGHIATWRARPPRRFGWGVQGGITHSGISYENNALTPDNRWGLAGGAYFENGDEDDLLELVVEAIFSTKGAKFFMGNDDEVVGLKYLNFVPSVRINVYHNPEWGIHVGVGPSIGLKLYERTTVNGQTLDTPDFTKSTDLGIAANGGIDFHKKWSACVLYTKGLTNIIKVPGTANLNAHNNSVQLTLGYRFR